MLSQKENIKKTIAKNPTKRKNVDHIKVKRKNVVDYIKGIKKSVQPEIIKQRKRKSSSSGFDFTTDKKLVATPLVYTTRLDDMEVLSKSEKILASTDNLVEHIEAESKPIFNVTLPITRQPLCKKYYLLKRKLKNYFFIRKSLKEFNRSQTPSRSATEVEDVSRLVLTKPQDTEDLNFAKEFLEQLSNQANDVSKNIVVDHKEDLVTVEISDSEDEPMIEYNAPKIDGEDPLNLNDVIESKNPSKRKTISVTSLMNQYKEKYIIVYSLVDDFSIAYSCKKSQNPTTILGYYQTHQGLQSYQTFFSCDPLQIINKCCWHRLVYNTRRLNFMKLPTYFHKCHEQNCECCCAGIFQLDLGLTQDDSQRIRLKKSELGDKQNQRYIDCNFYQVSTEHLFKRKKSRIIPRALAYEKAISVPSKTRTPTGKTLPSKHCTTLCFVNNKKKRAEYYTLSQRGVIIGHVISTSDLDNLSKKQTVTKLYNACCWTNRENIISEISQTFRKITPAVVKFMRRFHSCPSENCNCCCLLGEIKKTTVYLKNINLAPTTSSKLRRDLMAVNKDSHMLWKEYNRDESVAKKPLENSETPEDNTFDMQDGLDVTASEKSSDPPIVPPKQPDPLFIPENLTLPAVTPSGNRKIPEYTENISKHVLLAIEEVAEAWPIKDSICATFRNLNIILDRSGRAAATLDKPFTSLSSLELKILSKVLGEAQKTADIEKMNDSTYCTRLNLEKPIGDAKSKELTVLLNDCSTAAASKSRAFKKCIKPTDDILKGNIKTMMPIINNAFSLPQDQIHDPFIQCVEPTPGVSGLNTLNKIVPETSKDPISTENYISSISSEPAGYLVVPCIYPKTLLPSIAQQEGAPSIAQTMLNDPLGPDMVSPIQNNAPLIIPINLPNLLANQNFFVFEPVPMAAACEDPLAMDSSPNLYKDMPKTLNTSISGNVFSQNFNVTSMDHNANKFNAESQTDALPENEDDTVEMSEDVKPEINLM